jgi:hypothetical protein
MKIFFLSDVHGSRSRLAEAVQAFERERADVIAFLGDALYHGPRNPIPPDYDPASTAELLNTYKDRIIAVRGNCDSEVDQMLLHYPMSGDYAVIFENGRRIFLTHGHLYSPENLPPLSEGDVLAFGHTHVPVATQKDRIVLFNPGSVTLPKENHPPSYGLYDGAIMQIKDLGGRTAASCSLGH